MNLNLNYNHVSNGDLGNLSRVEIEKGSEFEYINFWSSGTANIHLVNTETGEDIIRLVQ